MDIVGKKAAVVTGGAKGIGRAIALKLAEDGFNIVVNYRSSLNSVEKVIDEIRERGSEAIAVQGDVSIFEDAKNIMKQAVDTFGR